jgi:ribosomal 50S subunit-associated protein YjgA (DUF615 family)
MPKHKQFLYTIIREAMVEDEETTPDKEIRNIINRLKRNGLLKKTIS